MRMIPMQSSNYAPGIYIGAMCHRAGIENYQFRVRRIANNNELAFFEGCFNGSAICLRCPATKALYKNSLHEKPTVTTTLLRASHGSQQFSRRSIISEGLADMCINITVLWTEHKTAAQLERICSQTNLAMARRPGPRSRFGVVAP